MGMNILLMLITTFIILSPMWIVALISIFSKDKGEKEDYIHNSAFEENQIFGSEENQTSDLKDIVFEGWDSLTQEEKEIIKKRQRSLMRKTLRETIMKRDNYTCQCCGRYMPDGFGIHIDHIVPISKGGLTVEKNLQVLCYKCNLHKSDKVEK